MKSLQTPLLGFLLVICFCLAECKKGSQASCGCDSPTIQSLDSVSGTLQYDSLDKAYVVIIGVPGLYNYYFICDTTSTQIKNITAGNHNTSYGVSFSGNVTNYCVPDTIVGYFDSRYCIKLTNIIKL